MGGCARSRRGCEQEELDEEELVAMNIAGDWSSASGGTEMEKRESAGVRLLKVTNSKIPIETSSEWPDLHDSRLEITR